MTNLVQLRHLIALADVGSFTQAARAVNRSQPAFSRSIAALERGLGVALFLGVLSTAREYLDAGELVQLPFDLKGMKSQFGLISLTGNTQPPAFLPLKKLILERFRDM